MPYFRIMSGQIEDHNMRSFSLIALLLALAIGIYLYQKNLSQVGRTVGAESPQEIKPKLDQLQQGLNAQARLQMQQTESRLRQEEGGR